MYFVRSKQNAKNVLTAAKTDLMDEHERSTTGLNVAQIGK